MRRARVEMEGDKISVIRALVVPEKSTRQVRAQISSLVAGHTGSRIPESSIHILRTKDFDPSVPRRRRLSSISTERSAERFKARVALELAGDVLVGESDGPVARQFEHRSVAQATLEGLNELLEESVNLESVEMYQAGGDPMAVVTLSSAGGPLVGSALVRLDDHDAIARATLDALNRILTASAQRAG